MTFHELKEALVLWKVVLLRRPGGQFFAYPAVKIPEDDWKGILARFEPEFKKHAWAINKHILDPWPLERIVAYLQHYGIGVKIKDGAPSLSRADMDEATWAYHTKTILPHMTAARAELIEWFSSYQGDATIEQPSAFQSRAAMFAALAEIAAASPGANVCTFSRYTRFTETLAPDARAFPIDATKACVAVVAKHPAKDRFIRDWVDLEGHTPPPGWRWPSGVMPPYPCIPPPNWRPKTSEQIRSERSRWYRENWKTAATFKGDEEE